MKRGQFGTALKRGQFGTKGNLAAQCKTDIIFRKRHTKILQLKNMCQLNKYICIGYILPTIGGIYDSWRVSVRPSGAGLGDMCQLNKYVCIGFILPTFGGYMTVGGFLCALRALGWETCVS